MNPRCTQLGHLALKNRGDLAGLFCAKLKGTNVRGPSAGSSEPGPSPSPPIQNDVIAFFPQSLLSHPRGGVAQGAHLDVPWDDPALVRELMRPSAPDRRLIARIYHHFNAPRTVATVEFESLRDTPPAMSYTAARPDRRAAGRGRPDVAFVGGGGRRPLGSGAGVGGCPPAPTSVSGGRHLRPCPRRAPATRS